MLKGVELRNYQQKILDDLRFLPSIGLFIKTGGGKTLTGLQKAFDNKSNMILVICPQRVVTQWMDVIKENTDFSPIEYKMSWKSSKKWEFVEEELKKNSTKRVVIFNYDIITNTKLEDYIDDKWTIIVDESHRIKNYPKFDRKGVCKGGFSTKKILELGELTPFKIILTATPAEKNYGGYIDFYTQLRFLGYIDYSLAYFKNHFCYITKEQLPGIPVPIEKITGYRSENIDNELKPILKTTCRYYSPVYGDYEPQKIRINLEKPLGYNKLCKNKVYKDITLDNTTALRIGKMTMTSGIVCGTDEYGLKLEYNDNNIKNDWLIDFLNDTDDTVAILYNFNIELRKIKEACEKAKKNYIVINGDIKDKPKELKKEFDVVIGQYEAFGESLDGLQYKCHIMVYYSLPFSSRAYKQSLGRIDRFGQVNVPTYYYLVSKGTIDEIIYDMISEKMEYQQTDLDMLSWEERGSRCD